MTTSKILYNEPPIAVAPSAVRLFGASTAIVLQQIHYWTYQKSQAKPAERTRRNWDEDGTGPWLWESAKEIGAKTGLSRPTVQRSLANLVEKGILICREPVNGFDRTKAYRLDYEALDRASGGHAHCSDRAVGVTRDDAALDRETAGNAHCSDRAMHWPDRAVSKEGQSSFQKDLFAPAAFGDLPPRQKRILDIAQRVWVEEGVLHPEGKPMTPRRLEIIAEALDWIDRSAERINPQQVEDWARSHHPIQLSAHDALFDALAEVDGQKWWKPVKPQRSSLIGMVAKRLAEEEGATADEVREKAIRYRERWPNVDLTATALEKHWERLDAPTPRGGPTINWVDGVPYGVDR